MALRSFQLFLGQVENAPTELKLQVLRVILDLLIMYDQEFFSKDEGIVSPALAFPLALGPLRTERYARSGTWQQRSDVSRWHTMEDRHLLL